MTEKDYLLCIQITDSHLFATPQEKLLGVPTSNSLEQVISLIQEEHPTIDFCLATGDISQDGSLASYYFFKQQIQRLNAPSFWTSGNHDNFTVLKDHTEFTPYLITKKDIGKYWRVITLNSQVIGHNHGKLSTEQLTYLLESLKSTTRFHIIALHHPPFSSNARWINDSKLEKPWELIECLEYFLNANVVVCGHIHQVVESYYRGTYLLSSPSTCFQFAHHTNDFKLDTLAPGYRWLKLFDNGHIETGISRLKINPYTIDHNTTKY